MSTKAALPWHKVEHSWSDTSIYDADQNPVFTSSIRDDATEDNQEELEAKQREVIDFTLTAVNHHQELITRLYNLVNEIESHFAGDPSHRGALSLRVTEARETLKKVIPTCIDINSKILTVPTIYFVDEDGTIGFANTGNGFKVFKYES